MHGRSLHLLVFSSDSSLFHSSNSIGLLFVCLLCIMNGIVSLIPFSDYLSMVYKKDAGYLYFVTYCFTAVFVSSRGFLVEPLGSLMYEILISENRDTLNPSFHIYINI